MCNRLAAVAVSLFVVMVVSIVTAWPRRLIEDLRGHVDLRRMPDAGGPSVARTLLFPFTRERRLQIGPSVTLLLGPLGAQNPLVVRWCRLVLPGGWELHASSAQLPGHAFCRSFLARWL